MIYFFINILLHNLYEKYNFKNKKNLCKKIVIEPKIKVIARKKVKESIIEDEIAIDTKTKVIIKKVQYFPVENENIVV